MDLDIHMSDLTLLRVSGSQQNREVVNFGSFVSCRISSKPEESKKHCAKRGDSVSPDICDSSQKSRDAFVTSRHITSVTCPSSKYQLHAVVLCDARVTFRRWVLRVTKGVPPWLLVRTTRHRKHPASFSGDTLSPTTLRLPFPTCPNVSSCARDVRVHLRSHTSTYRLTTPPNSPPTFSPYETAKPHPTTAAVTPTGPDQTPNLTSYLAPIWHSHNPYHPANTRLDPQNCVLSPHHRPDPVPCSIFSGPQGHFLDFFRYPYRPLGPP